MLRSAVEQFIDKSVKEIQEIAMYTLEGHQRALIMVAMTVDEIFRDRKSFHRRSLTLPPRIYSTWGSKSFPIHSRTLRMKRNMVSLGMARTSEIQRDARIGEAEANRDSQIETSYLEEQRIASKYENDTEIERYKRDFELKKRTTTWRLSCPGRRPSWHSSFNRP
ncbi:Flotillin-1 [Caligus rogercresseyi]|uniref:Flotillin-1 n=1 Tax=Caligus rogercresseyi TaxID=217165 RepID=A0A7T8GU72_CALRO|nr:Flotillin-1 [Caligus rogercresseyi]